ncbi:unnamed protein product [Symbiodinium natans]|uniref:Calx-beta domain-containing protein n=1 Tax=Symbiodinium natans TaxID=878477 RepID=A0A812IBA3_9DINO|nr:unnamed protein product [Symbiodinium natans]
MTRVTARGRVRNSTGLGHAVGRTVAEVDGQRQGSLAFDRSFFLAFATSFPCPPEPEQLSKLASILVGVLVVMLWEVLCTSLTADKPTILTELAGTLFPQGQKEEEPNQRQGLASVLCQKMDEFSKENAKAHFWSARTWSREIEVKEEVSAWELEESSCGPARFLPLPGISVLFFAEHTITKQQTEGSIDVTLLRVGDLSCEVSVKLATVVGTAKAENCFKEVKGLAVFPPGASSATFSVELLPHDGFISQRFFVVHVERIIGKATMGGCFFTRVRLLPSGVWPPGLLPEDVENPAPTRLARLKMVWAFAAMLLRRRGIKLWKVLASIVWLDFHGVVMNTLLLNYAIYDFCLTKASFEAACHRLPFIVLAKLVLVCVDRLASHVKSAMTGNLSTTRLLQEVVLHRYLQLSSDVLHLGTFLHMLFDTVPESVTYGYKTIFQLAHSSVSMVFSLLMAIVVQVLKGEVPPRDAWQPLLWILVPLHWTLAISVCQRRSSFNRWALAVRDSDIEKTSAMVDLLNCRQWLRAYDGAYPVQHVRSTFDDAWSKFLEKRTTFVIYKNDTQWMARYMGELTKVLGILFGGYAVVQHQQSGEGHMTIGRFTVFVSLYNIIVDVLYSFIEAWDGLVYAGILVEELAKFINRPSRWLHHLSDEPVDPQEHPIMQGSFTIKLDSIGVDLDVSPRKQGRMDAGIPLGRTYGLRTQNDASSLRRQLGEILGGLRIPSGKIDLVSCARFLLLKPPVTLAAGTVLENLLANAAAWVRASDVVALLALLGIPLPPPAGAQPRHALDPAALLQALRDAADQHGAPSPKLKSEAIHAHCTWFRDRCLESDIDVLSPIARAEELLQPSEKFLFDIARGLLADPEVLVVQDILGVLPLPLARNALQILWLWQRLGGLKGVILGLEGGAPAPSSSFPAWLTPCGGLPRTVFISESAIVCAGLHLSQHIDAWLLLQPGSLEIVEGALDD